mmetsp:Transcript_20841/g.63443  ORF Transcript_20841/g.63443 Transcript_20841/m.63443 type:complete len:684 (-) Transcript_20841:2166-4217(-)
MLAMTHLGLAALVCLGLLGSAKGSACYLKCNGHGKCNTDSVCECYENWEGASCEHRSCPTAPAWFDVASATDTAHGDAECSNRGVCDHETGQCDCQKGFTGAACQRLTCMNDCNFNGDCISLRNLAKTTYNSDSEQFNYDLWDADGVMGCKCTTGKSGADCSVADCPTGDDPLTTTDSNNAAQVNEKQILRCTANGGSFSLAYKGYFSPDISHDDTAADVETKLELINDLIDVTVTFSHGAAVCSTSVINIVEITFEQNFGPQPKLTSYTASLSVGGSVTVSADGATPLNDQDGVQHMSVKGTKEDDVCASRGACDSSLGYCICFETNGDSYGSSNGYGAAGDRGDCGYALTTISSCPGEVACNGHGACDTNTWRCSCAQGWMSGDCSIRQCPKGNSWFSYPSGNNEGHDERVECSDRGTCDRSTGLCSCDAPYSGAACEYLSCPQDCNFHGQCVSMREAAQLAETNGELTPVVYGSDPNNAATWDADRIFGCACDVGYTGYDCSEKTCPHGDDPGTDADVNEIQTFTCQAVSGTFTVSFRQFTTGAIAYDATVADLTTALEALDTINTVSVSYSVGASLCTSDSSNVVSVEFLSPHGDLPQMTTDTALLFDAAGTAPTMGVATSQTGTTEEVECSNRGICDRATGVCKCHYGYSSSNGYGGQGETGDCSYRNPHMNPAVFTQ